MRDDIRARTLYPHSLSAVHWDKGYSFALQLFGNRIYIYITGVGSGGQGGHVPPHFFDWGGGAMVCLCPPPPPLLTPHFYFPLELYVYITLTNNLAFLIYQLIILWTITIKWHRWLLVNNHISNYNSFMLVLYRRYINHVSVCPPPPPPPPPTHTFWHLATPLIYISLFYFTCLFIGERFLSFCVSWNELVTCVNVVEC